MLFKGIHFFYQKPAVLSIKPACGTQSSQGKTCSTVGQMAKFNLVDVRFPGYSMQALNVVQAFGLYGNMAFDFSFFRQAPGRVCGMLINNAFGGCYGRTAGRIFFRCGEFHAAVPNIRESPPSNGLISCSGQKTNVLLH